MPPLKKIVSLLLLILVIHTIATIYHWYWTYQWLDIPMHILGGFGTGLLAITLNYKFKVFESRPWINAILILGIVALVGVFWEFFEFILHNYLARFHLPEPPVAKNSFDLYKDTLKDLLDDIVGGFIATAFLRRNKGAAHLSSKE